MPDLLSKVIIFFMGRFFVSFFEVLEAQYRSFINDARSPKSVSSGERDTAATVSLSVLSRHLSAWEQLVFGIGHQYPH